MADMQVLSGMKAQIEKSAAEVQNIQKGMQSHYPPLSIPLAHLYLLAFSRLP